MAQLSSFLRQTIIPDERIIMQGRFHGFYTFMALVQALFVYAVGIGFYRIVAMSGVFAEQSKYIVYASMFLSLFCFMRLMLIQWTTEIVLTDRRFIFKRGIFSVRTDKMSIREVNYCEVRQSLLGNLMNYGRIYVYTFTLDDQNIFLPAIAQPHLFTSAIDEIKKRNNVAAAMMAQQQQQFTGGM